MRIFWIALGVCVVIALGVAALTVFGSPGYGVSGDQFSAAFVAPPRVLTKAFSKPAAMQVVNYQAHRGRVSEFITLATSPHPVLNEDEYFSPPALPGKGACRSDPHVLRTVHLSGHLAGIIKICNFFVAGMSLATSSAVFTLSVTAPTVDQAETFLSSFHVVSP